MERTRARLRSPAVTVPALLALLVLVIEAARLT
jgi:hypothetical protein